MVMITYVESVWLLTAQLLGEMMRLIRSVMATEGEMKLSLYSKGLSNDDCLVFILGETVSALLTLTQLIPQVNRLLPWSQASSS